MLKVDELPKEIAVDFVPSVLAALVDFYFLKILHELYIIRERFVVFSFGLIQFQSQTLNFAG